MNRGGLPCECVSGRDNREKGLVPEEGFEPPTKGL